MAIQNDWYIDYQNRLIAHATFSVAYDAQSADFHVGATVTSFSGGTAVIVNDTDGGTTGTLDLVYVSGTFADNDTLTDNFPTTPGAAIQNGAITAKTTVYSARQLYSFLQDTFDELVQMDDTVPMQAQTPTEFTLINGWFIDDESVKYLSGGAIDTTGYEDEVRLLSFLSAGYTNAVVTDIGKGVTQAGTTDTGVLLHYNNTTRKWWVRMDAADDLFDGTTPTTHTVSVDSGTGAGDLSIASTTGEDLYSNIYTLGTIAIDPKPKTYVFQNSESLEEWWGRGDTNAHIDVLIKAREAGTAIGDGSITTFVRHFGDLYDHFNITISTRGRYAVPLATSTDLNNNVTGEITIAYQTQAGGNFTLGNFVRDETTGAYGEILADDDLGTTGTLTIGNVIIGSGGSGDFTAGNGITETTTGLTAGDTAVSADISVAGVTAVVRGYNDIKILFVNATVLFTSGSVEPAVGERIYQGAGVLDTDPVGFYLGSTLSSGAWGSGTAAGTMYIANWDSVSFSGATALNGDSVGADFATCSGVQTVTSSMNKNFEQGDPYPYNVIVECANRTMAEVYEWFKYVTREDANSTQPPAPSSNYPRYSTMFRVSGSSIVEEDGEEYISAQTTYSPVKASPFGTLAGGKLFGARGVWLEGMATADRQNFQLIDSSGSTRTPPNFITITVNSVISGDKVTVFRTSSGSTIDKAQFTSGAGNTAGNGTFVITGTIPSDTPNYGHIRVVDISDTSTLRETRYAYSAWSNTTNSFTLSGSTTLDRSYVSGSDTAYVPYYDEVAGNTSVYVTVIYSADQSVLTRVRRYGGAGDSILPFQITGAVGTTGYTVAAIRTPDSIVA